MSDRYSKNLLSLALTVASLAFCLISLVLGWSLGIEPLVRVSTDQNAIVPATDLCVGLLAFASLPLSRGRLLQRLAVVLTVVFLGTLVMLRLAGMDLRLEDLLIFESTPNDGLSNATLLGLLLLAIAPAIRLTLLPLHADWQLHVPLFGAIGSSVVTALIFVDALTLDQIEPFTNMSHYTAVLFMCLFFAQLLMVGPSDSDTGTEADRDLAGL